MTPAVVEPGGAVVVAGLRLDGGLTRSAFLAHPVGAAAALHLRAGPWCTWAVAAELDGRRWIVAPTFDGEALVRVALGVDDPALGAEWAPGTEAARRSWHDAALASWGLAAAATPPAVRSQVDPKGGFAEIVIAWR